MSDKQENFLKGMRADLLERINEILWGGGMMLLLLGAGIYFTFGTKFFQLRYIGKIYKNTVSCIFGSKSARKCSDKHSISQFQSFSTALVATMGTGNIAGVATAITLGGDGAVFWMWVSAFFGMMTAFAENVLGILYRRKDKNGEWSGGPMAYLEHGLKSRFLAVSFALFCVLASFGMGNMAQVNSAAGALDESFGIPPVLTGIVTAFLAATVIFGGIKRIGKVTEMLIPFLSAVYFFGAVFIIILNIKNIPGVFGGIFSHAFGFSPISGGISGIMVKKALDAGVRRGVFSNEAGLGSSALLHSASDGKSPVVQGMWGIFEVFTDTIIFCTLTAVVILSTGSLGASDGAPLVVEAFECGFGRYAGMFVSVCISLFAFATITGWYFCGECCIKYIFGGKNTLVYKLIFVAVIIVGAVVKLETAWTISDIFNGLMAIPNILGILLLSKKVFQQVGIFNVESAKVH